MDKIMLFKEENDKPVIHWLDNWKTVCGLSVPLTSDDRRFLIQQSDPNWQTQIVSCPDCISTMAARNIAKG